VRSIPDIVNCALNTIAEDKKGDINLDNLARDFVPDYHEALSVPEFQDILTRPCTKEKTGFGMPLLPVVKTMQDSFEFSPYQSLSEAREQLKGRILDKIRTLESFAFRSAPSRTPIPAYQRLPLSRSKM
jgi:hypothetical protein